MKAGIHPEYKEITVTCSCGNKFKTKSTIKDNSLHVEVCSNCHPFYSGKQKIIDTAGRVDKFEKKYARVKKSESTDKSEDSDKEVVKLEQKKSSKPSTKKVAKKATKTTTTKKTEEKSTSEIKKKPTAKKKEESK